MTETKWPTSRIVLEWCGFGCVLALTVMFYVATTNNYTRINVPAADCDGKDCNERNRRDFFSIETSYTNHANANTCEGNERLSHLANVCENWRTIRHIRFQDPGTYWAMLVDDAHKVLYCIVPKAGCTSFQTMIINSTGRLTDGDEMAVHDPVVLNKLNFKYLHMYSFEEIIWRLEHYFKFMVVRHPFERLYSAYTDKIKSVPYFKQRYGDLIKKHFPSHDPNDNKSPLTLNQFLKLLAEEYDTGYKDRHWATFDEICHPCDIQYDYVGKLETVERDLPNLLPLFKAKDGSLPSLPKMHTKRTPTSSVEEHFRDVSPSIMRRVYSLYQMDFELFGYSWSNNTASHCSVKNGDQFCC